jgi:membrane protease YdiL (CAAX protease family)
MKSESSTSPASPAANLVHPPPRSAPGGIAVICAVVAILSAYMVAPHGFDLWAVAAAAILAVCAIALRSIHAVHLSLFGLIWIALPLLVPVFRPWPVCLIVPLVVYGILVATLPPLRHSFGWLGRGSLRPDILKLILATIVVSGVALIIWYLAVRPDTRHLVRFMPPMPVWLYPFAGLGFAMGNAALEETIFRGIVMDALDSAFGPGRTSILLQSVPFALLHFHGGFPYGFWGLAMTFIYGLMLGAIRRRSQGMLAPWLAHVGADTVIFAILAWIALH